MSIQWRDATSYSQGQRGRIEPTAWECDVNGIRVWVSNGHLYYPGEWVMNCPALQMEQSRIGPSAALTHSDAQKAALTKAASEASRQATRFIDFAAACQEPT